MYFVMISGEQIPLLQSRKTSLKIQDLVFQLLYLTIALSLDIHCSYFVDQIFQTPTEKQDHTRKSGACDS